MSYFDKVIIDSAAAATECMTTTYCKRHSVSVSVCSDPQNQVVFSGHFVGKLLSTAAVAVMYILTSEVRGAW